MKIYNSLTRKKEEFVPVKPGIVNIYTCGVTVYDDCHIGHARSLYIFDVMRRYLEYKSYKVNFVRNITDIDDKIIKRANDMKIGWEDLVKKYIDSYNKDLKLLGIRKGITDKDGEEPRATKNIPEMIRYIQGLLDKGYAYKADGDVYFDVKKFSDYGRLSHQNPDELKEAVRIKSAKQNKKNALDFALWKASKEGEPSWPSPWGNGRPGWHIECSVMSQKFLRTETLDIHAGGEDLIFPHHENEIAQAEALTEKPFAKYWIHHGLLTINGHKMSKSLGNFITIKDALKKYDADNLKMFYLQAHYSSPVDFSEKNMQSAAAAKERFDILFNKVKNFDVVSTQTPGAQKLNNEIDALKEKFIEAMDDDFNTPAALAALFEIVSTVNQGLERNINAMTYATQIIREFAKEIFGLSFWEKKSESKLKILYIKEKIKERDKARKGKDFKKADRIRQELQKDGIILEDTKEGATWRRL